MTGVGRKLTRAAVLRAAVSASGVALAAGCGATGDSASKPQTSAAPVEIVYWHTLSPTTNAEAQGRFEALKLSERANAQSVKVRYEREEGTNMTVVLAAAAANTLPNLFVEYPANIAKLSDLGVTIDPLAELKTLPDWKKVEPQIPRTFLPGLNWRGKMIALPLYITNQAIGYSQAALEKVGAPAPTAKWTWNDYRDLTKRTARPPDVWASSGFWNSSGWLLWAGSNGAAYASKDGTKLIWSSPESLAALDFMAEQTHGLQVTPLPPLTAAAADFAKGTSVIGQIGPYSVPALRQAGMARFEPMLVPVGPSKPVPYNWGTIYSYGVFKSADTAKQHAAMQLALGTLADQPQVVMCKIHLGLPITKSAPETTEFKQYVAQDRQMKAFLDMIPAMDPDPVLPSLFELKTMRNKVLTSILNKEGTVRNIVTDMERQGQLLVDADFAQKK